MIEVVYRCDKCHEEMVLEFPPSRFGVPLEITSWTHEYTDNVEVNCGGTIRGYRPDGGPVRYTET